MKWIQMTAFAVLFGLCFSTLVLAEPAVSVERESGSARPGDPYRVQYELSWPAEQWNYAVEAPERVELDWGSLSIDEMRSSVQDGQNVATLMVSVLASTPGTYEIPPIDIGYVERAAIPEVGAPEKPPPAIDALNFVRTEPVEIIVRSANPFLWSSGALVFAVLTCVLVWRSFAQRRSGSGVQRVVVDGPDVETAQVCLHAARQHRLDGAYYEYFRDLSEAVTALGVSTPLKELGTALDKRARDIGYKTVLPSDDDMDGALRDVERVMTKLESA